MSENKVEIKGFTVWGICVVFFLYEFFLRTVMGTYQNPIMQDLELTSLQFSLLSSTMFIITYGTMQIPAGLIIDNIGLKKSLILGSSFCFISSIGLAYSYDYTSAVAYRVIMGFGASFGFVCLLISVTDWMPSKYNGIFIGLSQFIGTLGPILAAGPVATLTNSFNLDWRNIFLILGIFGLILAILVFLFVENNSKKTGKYVIIYKPMGILHSISKLFARIQPWYIAFLGASLYCSLEYLSENEGRTFLAFKGISTNNAGYMLSTSWIGYALGCPLLGFISDIIQRRKSILNICSLLGFISITTIIYLSNEILLYLAFFMLGMSASGISICFVMVTEQFKKQYLAIGFGFNNTIMGFIAAINAPLIGILLDNMSDGNVITLNNYLDSFNILIALALFSIILSIFFLKETYCKSAVDFTITRMQGNHHR